MSTNVQECVTCNGYSLQKCCRFVVRPRPGLSAPTIPRVGADGRITLQNLTGRLDRGARDGVEFRTQSQAHTARRDRRRCIFCVCCLLLFVAVRLSTSNSSSASFAAALRKKGNTQKLGNESQHGGFEFGCWLTDLSPLHSFINIPLTCRIPTALLKGAQRAQCVFGRDVAVVFFFALLCIA